MPDQKLFCEEIVFISLIIYICYLVTQLHIVELGLCDGRASAVTVREWGQSQRGRGQNPSPFTSLPPMYGN
jgi:hypothetical protein